MKASKRVITFREIRGASMLTRPMSVWDGFIYNFLSMGVIFPWAIIFGPGQCPGAYLQWSIAIALLAQLPISLAYSFLATLLPVNGGDYVYQTRAFGKLGFVSVMSGFVLWILLWVALSGWLFACAGLAPLFLSLGIAFDVPSLTSFAVFLQGKQGVCIVSCLLVLGTVLVLLRGLRLYARIQRVLFALTLFSIFTVIWVLHSHRASFDWELDSFVKGLVGHLGDAVPAWVGQHSRFAEAVHQVADEPRSLLPSWLATSSWLATFGVVPMFWTSLQWATFSVEQNTEISLADRFATQFFMLFGSAVLVAILLIVVVSCEEAAVPGSFMIDASRAYMHLDDNENFLRNILQPFPSVLAMAVAKSSLAKIIIALGFLANAFQITCNCFIGVSRILLAMGGDRMLPTRMDLNSASTDRRAYARVLWLYFFLSLPVIVLYSFADHRIRDSASAAVTLACGYVFVGSCLAATRIPSERLRNFWMCSEIYNVPARVIVSVGYVGAACGLIMVLANLILPIPGSASNIPLAIVVALVLMISYAAYLFARSRRREVETRLGIVPAEMPLKESASDHEAL